MFYWIICASFCSGSRFRGCRRAISATTTAVTTSHITHAVSTTILVLVAVMLPWCRMLFAVPCCCAWLADVAPSSLHLNTITITNQRKPSPGEPGHPPTHHTTQPATSHSSTLVNGAPVTPHWLSTPRTSLTSLMQRPLLRPPPDPLGFISDLLYTCG